MIDLALDPSETRRAPAAPQRRVSDRPWRRIALFGVLGLAGTGAFASAASTYLSGLAGPQRAPIATRQKAADWPDLKDGLPALATGSLPAVATMRDTPPLEPKPPVVAARIESPPRSAPPAIIDPTATPTVAIAPIVPQVPKTKAATAAVAPKPSPAAVDVPVIAPVRQANLVPPARAVPVVAPLAAEKVRARTGEAAFAAFPPEEMKAATARPEATRTEPAKAKPRVEAHAKPPGVDKPAGRKAAAAEAKAVSVEAAPVEAKDEDTEVFGIKVPSFAPAGRKLRESVEAFGDAVKGIPDRF